MRYKRRTGLWLPDEKPPFGRIQLNQRHPLARGLVGCWLFNEGGGNKAFDLSGKQNHGVLNNGPIWKPRGLDFDGTDDYVNCGNDPSLDITNAITIEAWAYPTAIAGRRIVAKQKTGSYPTWELFTYNNNAYFRVLQTVTAIYKSALASAPINNWYHIVGVYNKVNLKIYLNGVETIGDAYSSNMLSGVEVEIGRRLTTGGTYDSYFGKYIDEVRVYNRALGAEEILELYRNPFGMFLPKKKAFII